jgi:hypothetical protein
MKAYMRYFFQRSSGRIYLKKREILEFTIDIKANFEMKKREIL